MNSLLNDFKKFLMQGNLVDLAVAFILAGAFKCRGRLSFVADIITPIIGGIFGQQDFSSLTLKIGDVGDRATASFLNTIINFVIIGAVLFLIVKAYEKMQKSMRSAEGGRRGADRARRAERDPRAPLPALA